MSTISINDVLFATVSGCGMNGLTLRLSGIMSYAQLLGMIRNAVGNLKGLITLTLRNRTQGWSVIRQLHVS